MWKRITANDLDDIRRCLALGYELVDKGQLDPSWRAAHLANVRWWLANHDCHVFFFDGQSFKIIVGFLLEAPGQMRALGIAVHGNVSRDLPVAAIGTYCRSFLRQQNVRKLTARIVPNSVEAEYLRLVANALGLTGVETRAVDGIQYEFSV